MSDTLEINCALAWSGNGVKLINILYDDITDHACMLRQDRSAQGLREGGLRWPVLHAKHYKQHDEQSETPGQGQSVCKHA